MRISRPRATKASQITWDVAAALVASLENGGINEISVAGLSGALADNQPFDESRIENGGAQEISVAGLSGLIPDNANITSGTYTGNNADNRPIAHGLGRIPKQVFLVGVLATVERWGSWLKGDYVAVIKGTETYSYACTMWTDTYFYTEASNTANGVNTGAPNETTFYWAAIG